MKYNIHIILLVLVVSSCKNNTQKELAETLSGLENRSIQVREINVAPIKQTDSIQEIWNELIFEKGGCLIGSQYVIKHKKKREGALFNKIYWRSFLNESTAKTTNFLISKFSDTTKTNVHTCPFFGATQGEIAVYSLQQIHQKNWYDFVAFRKYSKRETTSSVDQPQMWLRTILKNETERNKLADLFRREIKQ